MNAADITATSTDEITDANQLAQDAYWRTVRFLRDGKSVDLDGAGRLAWERWMAADKAITLGRDAHKARMYAGLVLNLVARS